MKFYRKKARRKVAWFLSYLYTLLCIKKPESGGVNKIRQNVR